MDASSRNLRLLFLLDAGLEAVELVGELGSIIAPGLMGGRFPWVCIIIIIVLRH